MTFLPFIFITAWILIFISIYIDSLKLALGSLICLIVAFFGMFLSPDKITEIEVPFVTQTVGYTLHVITEDKTFQFKDKKSFDEITPDKKGFIVETTNGFGHKDHKFIVK